MSEKESLSDADQWSSNAKHYEALNVKIPVVKHFNDVAVELLIASLHGELVGGITFVDVCAGPGTFTVALIKHILPELAYSIRMIVSDFAQGMVDAAECAVQNCLPGHTNVEFRMIDVQNIPLPTASADIISHMFGYFVPDRTKAFTEVYRVCKPGGTVIIGAWKYAGMAPLLSDFLVHLGREPIPKMLEVAHACADGVSFRAELLGWGYNQVTVHEHERVFELGFEDSDALMGMFANPMICSQLVGLTQEHLLREWSNFVRAPDFKYPVDIERNILFLKYIANLVICVK